MASGDKEKFPVAGVIQSSSRIIISQQSPSPSPGASKPQSYKVFVLPPSQLNSLGLVAKNENGRVILTERAIESTVSHNAAPNSNAAMSLAFIKTPEGIQIQSGQSSSSVKTTPKRGYVASAEVVKGAARELQVHRPVTKISTPGTNALGASSSRPMFARRSSSRRLLPQFTNYWKSSLVEKGYIRCPLRDCNYICLNFGEMTIHYYQCKGEPFASKYICTPCNGRLKSEEDLKSHYIETHSREGRIARKPPPKKVVELPKPEEKAQVWIRKRAYSKVHKISWNIALEEKGYVNCFFKNCCFMALDLNQMIKHYGICNGTTAATSVECPYCEACAECMEKLEAHVKKAHSANPNISQVVNPEVNIAVSVSDSLPVPVPQTNIASAVSSGINIGSSFVHQEEETVILSKKQSRLTSIKISAPTDKTVHTVVSMTEKLPKSLDQSHSRLSSDTISKTSGSLSSSADTEVHCLFSMYEDFDEQRSAEREILDSHLGSVGLSIKKECENTSTVLCKTYSKDNQRLVRDETYNERISSPLSALPCSFSDNISLCTDLSDIQIMRSSMSEGANNVMLVETKPEACAVEKLHEYMSHCDSDILNEENVSYCGTSLNSKEQKEVSPKLSASQISNPVSQESNAPHYELFKDDEPEYPQEYSLNSSINKTVKSNDINLSQNDLEEDKQVTVEECLFAESYASNSLVSYTEDVEEYIIPEIVEMTQYLVESPVEVCSKAVNKRIQTPNEKQKIASSQVPTNKIENLVPAKSNVSNVCKNIVNTNNNTAKANIDRPRSIHPVDSVKCTEPQAYNTLQRKVHSDIQVISQDNSCAVETSFTNIQPSHPLYADPDDLQNLDVPILASVSVSKDMLNSVPNSQFIDVHHAESDLSEVNQELYLKKSVSGSLIISDTDKLTNSVKSVNIEVLEKKNLTEAESADTANGQFVPDDLCNARLICEVNIKSENNVNLDVALNDNVLENVTEDSSARNQLSEISSLDISEEGVNNSLEQLSLKHKKNLSEIAINLPESEMSDRDLRDVKEKENALKVEHSSLKTLPQVHSIVEVVCSSGVQGETKISEVLSDELQEPVQETTIQTASHTNASNILQLPLNNSVLKDEQDESIYTDVECRIDEFQNESNQTLRSYDSILPSHNLNQDSQTSSENISVDKVLDKTLRPATKVPKISHSTKEGICVVANANLKENSSQIKEQSLKSVSSEVAGEFSHFCEMKNTDCKSVALGVSVLGDIQLHLDTNEKEIVRINTSHCEGLSYENESKSTKQTDLDSDVSSISVLKEEIELKIEENKSSNVELSDAKHSVPVVVKVEEFESNMKANEAKLSSVSFTDIEVERKDDHLHLDNIFSETCVSKDIPVSSQGGLMSTISETNAVISANSDVETAIKTLPDNKICHSLGNLPKDIESACAEDNMLESSSMAVNDLIVCTEQKYDNVKESISQGKDITLEIEKEDMNMNNSKISGVFPSSQCLKSEDSSNIVSASIKEVNVEKMTNIENDERSDVISQILEHSDTLVDENQEIDSNNLKMLDGDLITTVAENVQEVNQLCPPSEASDSYNKVNVLPITVPLISVTLESDNQLDGKVNVVECSSSMEYVSKTTEGTSCNEKFPQNELPSKGMLASKEDIRENETQLVSEVIPQTQNVLQISDCVTPFVEDLGPISNKTNTDFPSTEEMNEKRVKKESENENNSINDYNALHVHLSTVSETNVDESNVEIMVEPLPEGKECDLLRSLPRKIGNTYNVKPSHEDNQLDSAEINDNTLESSAANDWIACLEQKSDGVEESFLEHKSDTFKVNNDDMSTSNTEVIKLLPDSQSPVLKDPSQIVSSIKEINVDEKANIKNGERSVGRSQVLEHSDILENKSQEAATSNLKMLDDDLIVLDNAQDINRLYPPCEVTDSIDKMIPNTSKLISGSLESGRQSIAEIESNECTSLSDVSKATEEKNSQIEIVSEGGPLIQGITDSKKDTRENETQLMYKISPETQNTLQISECVTRFMEDIPVSNREIHECSSEEQMDVKIVREETEDEKISISVDDASCSHLNTDSESNILIAEKSNVAISVKPLCDDKKSDSLGSLSKEIDNTFNVMPSNEDNQLETSRMAISNLSRCSEQKYDKESSLEKDMTFKMVNKDVSTNSSKISGVLLDSQTSISEDPSKIVSASVKEVNIDKMTKIENVERSFVVSHAVVDSVTPHGNNQEADSNNMKILDGDLITTVADDVQEVNKLYSPTELPDSINKMDVLPPKIPLISGSFESDNQSNEDVGPVESLSLSDASQATEEKNCQIENVSERGLFPKVIPDSKDIGENVTSLVHEESSKTQNALEASESVTPFVEDTKPETSREIHEFFSEEQMGVKIVTEESKDEKISVIVDGASCLNMNITSESNELITEKNNIVKTLKPLCDDKESDLPKEVNNTLNVMSSDENNHLELSRMAVNDLSPCSEQKYDIAKESLLEIKDMSTNSSKISGVLSDSQTAITEDPSRIVSSSIKERNIDRMANIKNVEKSVSVSQVIMDYGTPQDDNQEADSNLKTLDGDLTTTVADDVQEINELYYSSSEFTDSINKMDVLPTTVPLVSGSLELDSHSNAQVDAVECTSLSNESKTTEEFYSSIENIPESGLILKQMSDSKKDIKENETQLCEESSETQTALQVSECVTPCVEDIVSVSNKKIQEFENTKVVTTSTDITEEQMEVKFGTEELVDKKILISDDEVSLMTNIGKVKSETLLSCASEKTQEEGKALTSTDICSEVKIIEKDVGFQDLTVDRESSEAKLIQETKNAEKEVCVVKGITVAERTVSSMKDNFLSAPDEECILMSCQKQDNVNIVVPSLLPLKKTNDTILSLTESSISEEPSIASECSLTGSPKIFQELGESCGYEKHLKPTSEALQSIKEENESSISEDIQEEAKEPSVLSCNVSIVADTKNITGFDFNAKSNVLEYIKDQEEVLNAKAGLDKEIQEIIETKNENKISDSLVPLTEKSEQTKETTLGTEFSGTSLLETRTLLGREQNVLGGMSEQFINSPTSNEASVFSETTITLSENVKRLSLENLSIALAGEMEDSPEHVSSHEMLGVDSYSNKAHSDSKKLLIPRDAFSKTFENYALDSPKAVSESDEKIYSTQDLQQILEGSDDSKHKLEDEETSSSTVPSENVLCSNESKDMLKREENDPSHLHNMNEIVSSSDSVKVIEKTFETELTEINLSRDKDSSWRKRRHSTDFSIKMEIDGECANYCSPVKRKRSSSFCCDLTTNYEKNGKLHLLKSTLIKETMKSNEQLEKLESNANLSTSYSDITESCGPTDTQDFGEVTNQNKLSNEEGIVHTKGTSVTNSNLHEDTESKCMFHASEDSVSNTNIYEQNRKINEAIHLPLETNNVQVDAVTVTCLEEKNRFTPENKTDLVCTEPPRLRRKRSIETREEEAEVKRKSRRQSLRNKTIVSEDSNSSNSSVNSASDIVGGRKTRRGRKSRKVDDSVNTNVNSVSNTPQKENSEGTILKQTKTGNLGESETQQILPYDSEQSIMSEDSVFSKTDSLNEFDSNLEVDDSASSTVGSIISDDSKDWAEDSQIGIDQESDMSEIGTNCQGQGKGGGRGQSRRRNYRRGSKRRVHWRRRGVQKVGGREEEEESQGSSLPVDSGNSCAQEELMESNEIEQRREDPNEEIQCGKCKEKMKRKSYDRHNASIHSGLSWLEGEPPFDMSNEKLVLSTLWKVAKTRRFLTCENCGESKKSAVGFWSHIAFCQRSAEEREALKVMCDICGRYMIPASLKVHLQMHRAEPKPDPCVKVETPRTQRAAAAKATSLLQEVMKEETQGEDKKVVRGSEEMVDLYQRLGPVKPSNSTLAKWKRLVAAEQQLECHFPGCTFKSADLEVMIQHFGKCEKCPRRVYSCDLCDFQSKNEKEMQLHLTKEHFGNLEESDPDDPKSLKMQSKLSNWKVCNKLLFLGREMSGTANGDRPFLPAVKWTLKFMQENYAKEDLFPDYHTTTKDWIPVPESEYSQYLPQTTESISFSTLAMREEVVSTDSVTFNWRRMKIFESDIIDGVPTLFTGGPIWALAWATNPLTAVENETRDQFLAVSCHQHMGDTYKSNERNAGKGLIQLWNFGPLDNLQRSTSNPKFALGIAHEYGSVWDLEWCPSGCYETTSTNEHLQRLGLLAAACSDGCVHIFSVCFPNSLANDARYPIFRCKPVMTLTASENLTCELGGLPWSCLRLSWYKGKDHSVVAGGFNNGMVSLWNIRTESLLLRKEEDGTSILLPYKSFQAHLSCVTALSLSSQDEGRYLMTGSKDTTIKVWDMEDSSGPIPPVVRKGMVTDGIWLTHWLSSITSFDDVYSMGHCNTTLNPPRGYGFKLFPLLPQNSVTWSLSTTDWVNGIAQSTHAGELTVIFPHQLFLNVDTEKGNKDKRLILSYVELKDIVNETEKHKCESSCSVPCKKQQLGDLQKEIESNKSKNPSEYEKVMFQLEEKDESEKGGLSFVIERNPRKGKKCVITPLSEQIYDSTSVSDSSFANDSVNDGSDSLENIECISMLNQHEKRLLFTFKKDLERLNVTSRLKVTFPYYNNEKKKSNSNDTVKEFLMIVGSVNDDIKTENCSQESSGSAKAIHDDDSMFTIPSDDYEAVESKFGMIFCDFPANNLSTIPAASRLWTRKSETMKTAPVEIYPVTSLNKVKWNPNCRSFLWLAAGYQCGLLRVPCISGMHNKDVEQLLRHTTWQKV